MVRKKLVDATVLSKSAGEGPLFGFRLSEGRVYEFEFAHRYPAYIGTDQRMPPFRMTLNGTGGVGTYPGDEEVSGNYETHFFRAFSPISSKMSSELILDPEGDSLAGSDGNAPIPRLKLPVRVKVGIWYRLRTRWAWLALMLAALFVANLISFSTDEGIAREDVLRFAVAAAIAAFAIFASQQRSTK
jgi:hypothetical protein